MTPSLYIDWCMFGGGPFEFNGTRALSGRAAASPLIWRTPGELLGTGCAAPAVNQIEINPFLYQKNTIDYFRRESVVLQSYQSLCNGQAMDHPALARIGLGHYKSPVQVLGRWCVQRGFVYMPKSVRRERMVENGEVFDFELSVGEDGGAGRVDAAGGPGDVRGAVSEMRQ